MKSIHIIVLIIFSLFTTSILANSCETTDSGNWSDSDIWGFCGGLIPQDDDSVVIKAGHTVLLNQDTSDLESMMVEVNGDFNVATPGFRLNANTSGGDIDLSNANIDLSGFLSIVAKSHNIVLGDVDGNFGLTLFSQLETRLIGTIGGTIALSSLKTNSASTTVFANVNGSAAVATIIVDGDRIFSGPVLLAEYTNIQGNGGVITFDSTLDSETNTDEALAITFASGVDISFNGEVGENNRLERLQIINSTSSTTYINTSKILTNRNQRWGTDIVLNSPSNPILMNVGINGSIKIGSSGANHTVQSLVANTQSLTIESPDVVSIFSTIGDSNKALDDFTIESTSTMLLYNDITVGGTQFYIGPMALAGDAVLSASTLDFRETVNNDVFDLTLNPSSTISNLGVFSGSGDIIKQGTGSFAVHSSSTVTGDIFINQGSITNSTGTENAFANASGFYLGAGTSSSLGHITTDIFILGNGQKLAGTGTCDCFLQAQSGSEVSPGFSPGILNANTNEMYTGSSLSIELNGSIAGTDYDQLIVDSLNLDKSSTGGASLNVTADTSLNINDAFRIVDVTSGDAVSGVFNGLPEGSTIEVNGKIFSISYVEGTGNDVVLTLQNIVCETKETGMWSDVNTWINCNNGIPQDGYNVIVNDTHTVTLNQDTALLEGITVAVGGDLNVSGSFDLLADDEGADFDLRNASIELSGGQFDQLTIDSKAHNILLGDVDGSSPLQLKSTAEMRIFGTIGGTTPLRYFGASGSGTTVLANPNGNDSVGTIFVSNSVVFNSPVLLAEHTNIKENGEAILFVNTINSENTEKDLIISNALNSTITMVKDIGVNNRLSNIKITNSTSTVTIIYSSQVLTSGDQVWESDIELFGSENTLLNSNANGSIQLGATATSNTIHSEMAGTNSLTIETNGEVIVNSNIGDSNLQLSSFSVNSASTIDLNSSSITVDNTITFAAAVTMSAQSELIASVVDFQSDVENAGFDLTINTTDTNNLTNITGVLSGTGDFIKDGTGDMAFNSINTFSGDLLLSQGWLNNNTGSDAIFPNIGILSLAENTIADLGNPTFKNFQLDSNQSVIGKGTCFCNFVTKNGANVSPGFSPGRLLADKLVMDTGSTLFIEIDGNTVNTEYDQLLLDKGGNLNADLLGGGTLELSIGFNPVVGDTFTIIYSDGPITGNFDGLVEDALFVVDDKVFSITYIGRTGNDVILTYLGDPILYVNHNAIAGGDGQSWTTAFDNLQDALAVAVSGMEIWVSQGVYYPNISTIPNPNNETLTFALIEGVDIYGGFNGTETELNQRNPDANVTILSGDIDGNDLNTDSNNIAETVTDIQGGNAYHVLNGQTITDSTIFDGFTVTAGSATIVNPFDSNGGGMLCNTSDGPTINQVSFIGNIAAGSGGATYGCTKNVTNSHYLSNQSGTGGAVYSRGGNFENVSFKNNESVLDNGGALFAQFDDITLTNVLFSGNKAFASGGAVYIYTNIGDIMVRMTNTTISGNNALISGGGLAMSITGFFNFIDINNSIFWNNLDSSGQGTASASINSNIAVNNNYSLIQGFGITGIANLDEDPLFITDTDPTAAPTSTGNAGLMSISIAIDAGNDSVVTTLYDLDGNDRIQGTVDMGAYEFTDLIFANGFE